MSEVQNKKAKVWGRRLGRPLRKGRQSALEWGGDNYSIDQALLKDGALNLQELFGQNPEKLWLEIGFGSGEALLKRAQDHGDIDMIGCEPFLNGLSLFFKGLHEIEEEKRPQNVRIWPDDARFILEALPPQSVDRCFILFPDPWPKTRHHKRRFVQKENLDHLARIMKKGGSLELATDHQDLAEWMLYEVCAHKDFQWVAEKRSDWIEEPDDWVRTRYQEKAKAGKKNWFINSVRVD